VREDLSERAKREIGIGVVVAGKTSKALLGATVSDPVDEPDHGVTVVFVELPNTKIELLHPLGDASPIAGFLEKNPSARAYHKMRVPSNFITLIFKLCNLTTVASMGTLCGRTPSSVGNDADAVISLLLSVAFLTRGLYSEFHMQ